MGVFYEQTEVYNRTSKPLNARFDGQDVVLEPNYTAEGALIADVHNLLPTIAVQYAKNQNILMGSEHPTDPSDFEVLVGIKAKKGAKQKDDISYCEQSDEPTPVRLSEYLDDPTLTISKGGRQKTRRGDAQAPRDVAPFEVRPK